MSTGYKHIAVKTETWARLQSTADGRETFDHQVNRLLDLEVGRKKRGRKKKGVDTEEEEE